MTPDQPHDDHEEEIDCAHCGQKLDECAFCEEPDCGALICYGCLTAELGQSLPQPHTHGG